MTHPDFDYADIEARARKLRAEAAAYGWSQLKSAIKASVAKWVVPGNLGARRPA